MLLSQKTVRPLDECVIQKLFIIPKDKANNIDPVTGESCISVQINGKSYFMPVGRPTPIDYNAFTVLRDLNIVDYGCEVTEGFQQ